MVRVCVAQFEMQPHPVNSGTVFREFLDHCAYFADVAADYGADFLLFPEMVTNQVLAAWPGLDGPAALKTLGGFTAQFREAFSRFAVERKVNIIGGSHFTPHADGHTYNVATLFRRDGTASDQRKLHVTPGERSAWGISPGDDIHVLPTDCGKIAIQICYDVEFPETIRRATDLGAEILFVPYCTDDRQGHLRVRYCAHARTVENQIYVATAGVTGNLRGVPGMDVHYAESAILTPSDFGFARDGIAASCPPCVESVAVADLDLAALAKARKAGTVKNLADRRPDLYAITWRPRP